MKCIICDKENNRKLALYCDEHRNNVFQEAGRKSIFDDIKQPITNNERWAIIGASSSLEAMRELAGLKNTITVMSKL